MHPQHVGKNLPLRLKGVSGAGWNATTKETPNIEQRHLKGGGQRPLEARYIRSGEPLCPAPPLGSEPFLPLCGPRLSADVDAPPPTLQLILVAS